MTPDEVRAMTLPEYLAFNDLMDRWNREQQRQARKANRGR